MFGLRHECMQFHKTIQYQVKQMKVFDDELNENACQSNNLCMCARARILVTNAFHDSTTLIINADP